MDFSSLIKNIPMMGGGGGGDTKVQPIQNTVTGGAVTTYDLNPWLLGGLAAAALLVLVILRK